MPYIFAKFTFRIPWSSAESWNRIQDLKTYSKYSLYQPQNMNVLTQNAANKIVEMRALLHWCSFLIRNSVVFSSSQAYREFNHTAGPHFSNYPTIRLGVLDITLTLQMLALSIILPQYFSVNPQLPENICDKSCHSTVAFANRKPSFFDPASTLGSIHGYTKLLTCFRPSLVIPPCLLCKTHSQESQL